MLAYAGIDREHQAGKLGLLECSDDDLLLLQSLHELLQAAEVDMTLFFRGLAEVDIDQPELTAFREAFYDEEKFRRFEADFALWLGRYVERVRRDALPPGERRARMNAVNPRYVLRNYLAQQAIDRAEQGDPGGIDDLLEVMRRPYDLQPGREAFAARRPDWARDRAGCSMLSCSS